MNLDPELREILERVLGNPSFSLPQESKERLLAGIDDGSIEITERRPGLSALERELLAVERHELEDALYRIAIGKLLDDRQARADFIHGCTRPQTATATDCERRLAESTDPRLDGWPHGYRVDEMTTTRVLSLCLQLRNDPTTRVILAGAMAEEQPLSRDAERMLLGVLSTPLTEEVRMSGLMNLGLVYAHSGRPRKALRTYGAVAERFPYSSEAVFGALRNALAVGDEAAARRLADHLADVGRSKIPILISNVRALPFEARSAITDDGRALARTMSLTDSRIGELLHEIAQL